MRVLTKGDSSPVQSGATPEVRCLFQLMIFHAEKLTGSSNKHPLSGRISFVILPKHIYAQSTVQSTIQVPVNNLKPGLRYGNIGWHQIGRYAYKHAAFLGWAAGPSLNVQIGEVIKKNCPNGPNYLQSCENRNDNQLKTPSYSRGFFTCNLIGTGGSRMISLLYRFTPDSKVWSSAGQLPAGPAISLSANAWLMAGGGVVVQTCICTGSAGHILHACVITNER